MKLVRRPARVSTIALLVAAIAALSGGVSASALASPGSASPRYVALPDSASSPVAARTGSYSSPRMSVEVALAPRDEAGLNTRLTALYARGSGSYHHWLAKGQFDADYAPAAARTAVARYLSRSGLVVHAGSSPFLVRATGSSQQVSAAFGTTLNAYRAANGSRFFANSAPVRLPAALAPAVQGVIGLSNTVRLHPATPMPARRAAPSSASGCETSYPTDAQLFNEFDNGVSFPFGYGGGPGCSGLTPSQVNSIYNAPNAGPGGKGEGVTIGLVEFATYQQSDDATWAHTFYGSGYTAPLENVNVDGGSLNPQCPPNDTCAPASQAYTGDIEVDLDIQRLLTVSPDVAHIVVYDAPNDATGQTEVDEENAIANADAASVVSDSWGNCEAGLAVGMEKAENTILEQMAAQGQSFFAAAGDSGAFDCLYLNSDDLAVDDPPSQPYATAVGGSSLESDNPGSNLNPSYPAGVETVWNVNDLCNGSNSLEGGQTGYFWCSNTDAGGGGSSALWGMPSYQKGSGVINSHTTYGNGTTQCKLAAVGTACREVPDISANADEYTPYSGYCTGNASTPGSVCEAPDSGWQATFGTSSSTPLWAGIAADRNSFQGIRSGFFNYLLYDLYNMPDPGKYFHDITGTGQTVNNNGMFPTTPGYDEATGIGTPNMAALITESSTN